LIDSRGGWDLSGGAFTAGVVCPYRALMSISGAADDEDADA
jgi:hypothetical protein